jgi:hypothetical protein
MRRRSSLLDVTEEGWGEGFCSMGPFLVLGAALPQIAASATMPSDEEGELVDKN